MFCLNVTIMRRTLTVTSLYKEYFQELENKPFYKAQLWTAKIQRIQRTVVI